MEPAEEPERQHLADAPVQPRDPRELRQDPFVNRDNIALTKKPTALAELRPFAREGGRTVVDPTCRGIGRNPAALRRISERTGLRIVMGAGYYLADLAPARARDASRPMPSPTRSSPRRSMASTGPASA